MNDIADFKIIMNGRDVIGLREEIEAGQKTLDLAWDEINDLRKKLTLALEAESNANARFTDLEDVADKLYQSLQEVLHMQVNGYDLQDQMQFSMSGRAISGKAYAARKLYEAMKGGSA